MRTEFLFLERDTPPCEEEQYRSLPHHDERAQRAAADHPHARHRRRQESCRISTSRVRTIPFLGVRGVRLCLRHPELFEPQLRAIYRASETGPGQDHVPDDRDAGRSARC